MANLPDQSIPIPSRCPRLDPTAPQICAFPAVGPNTSTALSPSQPFPPPDPALPHIPHSPILPVRVTLIPLLLKPRGSLGIQPWEGHPNAGSTPGSSPIPVDIPLPAHPSQFQLLCLLPVLLEQSRQEQAGQSKAQPFLHHGLLEGAQPSPLSHFCHKIHVCGFSHAPNPKDTFPHVSPGSSRARLGSALSQLALPHPTCSPVLASVPVDNQSPNAILMQPSPRKDTLLTHSQ